ncbi:hypothetical protein ERJ75_000998400 [Trypanosoma vivax]|uniref:Uncharacterized protein n=1 Tax=Trypanosoma vivax (strain Y486) TaxID=1055687 RepID=G0UAV0_TRYVY|nr:hypothetical protein TRVL_00734 [Trypanosoma vivax]KAH8611661.1 hypothetical protein ERJ75_000998400 [Trypanosoma vivax]CCC52937.1 conserved hypothetical protein [Trypanosoma vivax Y486]
MADCIACQPIGGCEMPTRDDISIVFHRSEYPTAYGDNSIPGNHPGHRHKRMGRRFAPEPLTKSALCVDLYIHDNTLGRFGTSTAMDVNNTLRNTLLPRDVHNGHYVLDSVRGGRRHFCEERGHEPIRLRGQRRLEPPPSETALPRSCRAPGIYNYNKPNAQVIEAMNVREREQRLRDSRKAMVMRPADHHPFALGFYQCCETLAPPAELETTSPTKVTAKVVLPNLAPEQGEVEVSVKEDAIPLEVDDGHKALYLPTVSSYPTASSRLRDVYIGTRRSMRPKPETMQTNVLLRGRRMEEAAERRREDVLLVEQLPK